MWVRVWEPIGVLFSTLSPNQALLVWGKLQCGPLPLPPGSRRELPDPVFSPLPERDGGREVGRLLCLSPWCGASLGRGDPLWTLAQSPDPTWTLGTQGRAQRPLPGSANPFSSQPPPRPSDNRVGRMRRGRSANKSSLRRFLRTLVSIFEGQAQSYANLRQKDGHLAFLQKVPGGPWL